MHPCNNVGPWTVNKKSEECVTMHSAFLEMSYELNIKMKCVAPLPLGDAKMFVIDTQQTILYQVCRSFILWGISRTC